MTARMGCYGAGANAGIWVLPPLGAEVAVVFPEGELTGGPIIVGILSTGNVPDGIAADTMVIASGQVLINDGNGGATALPTLQEFNQHTHPTGVGPSSTPTTPATGTSVLKAK